jgi:hypothetical protein
VARPEQQHDDRDRGERNDRKRDPLRRCEQEGGFEAPDRLGLERGHRLYVRKVAENKGDAGQHGRASRQEINETLLHGLGPLIVCHHVHSFGAQP